MLAMQLIINQTSVTNPLPCALNYYKQHLGKILDEALTAGIPCVYTSVYTIMQHKWRLS